MFTINEVAENFRDLITGRYRHTKSTRVDQYAVWNHFFSVYYYPLSDIDKFAVFKKTYWLLDNKDVGILCGWISSKLTGLSISYKELLFYLLENETDEVRRECVINWFNRRIKKIPHEIALLKLTDEEVKSLKNFGINGA